MLLPKTVPTQSRLLIALVLKFFHVAIVCLVGTIQLLLLCLHFDFDLVQLPHEVVELKLVSIDLCQLQQVAFAMALEDNVFLGSALSCILQLGLLSNRADHGWVPGGQEPFGASRSDSVADPNLADALQKLLRLSSANTKLFDFLNVDVVVF